MRFSANHRRWRTVALPAWTHFLARPFLGGQVGGAVSDLMVWRGEEPRRARMRMMSAAACLTPLALVAKRTIPTRLAIVPVVPLLGFAIRWYSPVQLRPAS